MQLYKTDIYPRIQKYAKAEGVKIQQAIEHATDGAVNHWLQNVDPDVEATASKRLKKFGY